MPACSCSMMLLSVRSSLWNWISRAASQQICDLCEFDRASVSSWTWMWPIVWWLEHGHAVQLVSWWKSAGLHDACYIIRLADFSGRVGHGHVCESIVLGWIKWHPHRDTSDRSFNLTQALRRDRKIALRYIDSITDGSLLWILDRVSERNRLIVIESKLSWTVLCVAICSGKWATFTSCALLLFNQSIKPLTTASIWSMLGVKDMARSFINLDLARVNTFDSSYSSGSSTTTFKGELALAPDFFPLDLLNSLGSICSRNSCI